MSFASKSIRAIRRVSSGAIDKTVDKPQSLARIIAKQDWDGLREVLSASDADAVDTENAVFSLQYSSEEHLSNNAVHFTCQYHPPWDVIKLLDKINPDLITQVDTMGRTALHVAAKNGASPQVIRYLCAKYPDAAKLQDIMGKTPLHFACEFYVSKYDAKKNDNIPLKESMRDVVRTICRAAPTCVNLEDIDGMGALEYAIDSGADLKVVRDIQKACEKDWKKRRVNGVKHDDLKQQLKEEFDTQKDHLGLGMMKLMEVNLKKDSSAGPRPIAMMSSRRTKPARSNRALCA